MITRIEHVKEADEIVVLGEPRVVLEVTSYPESGVMEVVLEGDDDLTFTANLGTPVDVERKTSLYGNGTVVSSPSGLRWIRIGGGWKSENDGQPTEYSDGQIARYIENGRELLSDNRWRMEYEVRP